MLLFLYVSVSTTSGLEDTLEQSKQDLLYA